ncbi:hypothetical protein KY316_04025 [Candidatus Woesearchaeota archaeon]|nr:hypothetical protein [Candidatus Woesearchaeota archaeon]
MQTVDDIIATLSPEEREKLKAVIEECRQREQSIQGYTAKSLEMLGRRAQSLQHMETNSYANLESAKKLLEQIESLTLIVAGYRFDQDCRRKENSS